MKYQDIKQMYLRYLENVADGDEAMSLEEYIDGYEEHRASQHEGY